MSDSKTMTGSHALGEHPDLPPPTLEVGLLGWLRKNLFSNWSDTAMTIVALLALAWLVPPLFDWLFFDAVWSGSGSKDCLTSPDAACWAYVTSRLNLFIYGFFPAELYWRVDLAAILLVVPVVMIMFERMPYRNYLGMYLLLGYPLIAFLLLHGGILGLSVVETRLWGGLMLTLVIALTGIVASLPIGVVLALGRRSNMPVISRICIVFIEFWRGVPLITVLFMASVMFPLFLPEGVTFNELLRALIGVALFSSAYMAEVVRGGLQAIPKGQYEAADAMGLGYWQATRLIILPQALKIVIPGIVNTFIGLFKDTTLVSIIGLYDYLNAVQSGNTDSNWLAPNVPYTGYVFAAAIYWAFCYSMSRYSQFTERKLDTGHRN